jgi:hypothetical protein
MTQSCGCSSPMPRYSLRTLLILLAIGPLVLAGVWFGYLDYRERQRLAEEQRVHRMLTELLYPPGSRQWLIDPDN